MVHWLAGIVILAVYVVGGLGVTCWYGKRETAAHGFRAAYRAGQARLQIASGRPFALNMLAMGFVFTLAVGFFGSPGAGETAPWYWLRVVIEGALWTGVMTVFFRHRRRAARLRGEEGSRAR